MSSLTIGYLVIAKLLTDAKTRLKRLHALGDEAAARGSPDPPDFRSLIPE